MRRAFELDLFRCLRRLIGILAGLIAYVLYDLIGLFTNLAYYHEWSFHFRSPETYAPGTVDHRDAGDRRDHRGLHGEVRLGKNQRARNSGSDGSGAHVAQPDRGESCDPEAAFRSDCDWNRRAIWRGGADHPDGRGDGLAGGPDISTTAAERKVLLACGAGAGMAATFNTPIAGVILAIELLLFEFRSRSFIPLVIASTLATSVRSMLLGQRSMFTMGERNFDALHGLPFYLLLGVLCGIVAIGFTKLLYWVEDQFERLPDR